MNQFMYHKECSKNKKKSWSLKFLNFFKCCERYSSCFFFRVLKMRFVLLPFQFQVCATLRKQLVPLFFLQGKWVVLPFDPLASVCCSSVSYMYQFRFLDWRNVGFEREERTRGRKEEVQPAEWSERLTSRPWAGGRATSRPRTAFYWKKNTAKMTNTEYTQLKSSEKEIELQEKNTTKR